MNMCGGMVRARVDDFRSAAESLQALLAPPEPTSTALPMLSWVWGKSDSEKGKTGQVEEGERERARKEAERYVRALEDCVAGGVHWLYETPLFFGAQGAEIRAFGWVFANEPAPATAPGGA